jgi:hypothetical protein
MAYNSDPLDEKLKQQGSEMIAPNRGNRKKKKTQNGRKLRFYRRRWKVAAAVWKGSSPGYSTIEDVWSDKNTRTITTKPSFCWLVC